MSKPDPDQFAKAVLWRLAVIQAEVTVIKSQLTSLEALQVGEAQAEISHEMRRKMIREAREEYYLEDCRSAGLKSDETPPPGL
jgi:hypothetical protein